MNKLTWISAYTAALQGLEHLTVPRVDACRGHGSGLVRRGMAVGRLVRLENAVGGDLQLVLPALGHLALFEPFGD